MLTKQFLKSKPVCKTTFVVPAHQVNGAEEVALVGDFNDWDTQEGIQMKKQKNGDFKTVINLEAGKQYQFRYMVNGEQWINDAAADDYVATPFGSENSIVSTLN